MRRQILAIGIGLALASCGDLDRFDVPVEGTVKLAGSPVGQVPILEPLPFEGISGRTFRKAFSDNGASVEEVESVTLKSMRIRIESPAESDLAFIDGIAFYIEAPGLERQPIASAGAAPEGARELELETTGANLKPYVISDEMKVEAEIEGVYPQFDTALDVRAVFEVDAGVL